MNPPYRRIAAAIRARIEAGELLPGERVPSTRALTREWGVAMATATKALDLLRQEGLVEAHPGAGTVVRTTGAKPRREPPPGQTLTRFRITTTAIRVADAEGLEAVSMRRLATELAVGPMSLYRHIAGKEELVHLMLRQVFRTRPLPDPPPRGWRERLNVVCRLQWALYRAHAWLPELISVTRPLLIPEAMLHTEWTMEALHGLRLTKEEQAREALTLPAFVRGLALSGAAEQAAVRASGMTTGQWWLEHEAEVQALFASGRFPRLATLTTGIPENLDALFEHALRRHLAGIEARLRE
ncbi:TetR/AcrR family transcriptional regulator C-terminal domain-containing protein [Allokutzneria sp. A3M-2-11 16]|uniref:TetR/AcrR family transcriptional regulator C-terminal domain-containing protein n=1 Tax=Allokutzneria sp. A3M-2-11 16 TaxID=2962043 RepID=UPI0020B813C8|nr:GntR family transcriptional regulator [Allokutzneria sp. A3M-2-11 16]MCP3801277.1 TetR/AcrR family transcriptional regulator C-terminal domain-containing protein [Allokutzneria sp. A3M-2-11 16]